MSLRTRRHFLALVAALSALSFAPARAQLTIEIVGGAGTAIPIAIVPFEGESAFPLGVSGVVAADLQRSGLFRPVDPAGVAPRPFRAEEVKLDVWRARGADAVVVGTMRPQGDGRVEVVYALVDAVRGGTLASTRFVVAQNQFRATAHRIADEIYQKLTGDAGVFSTRIAYVARQGRRFQLVVADADGADPQTIVSTDEPILSPRWSPDGTRIAYVSLEQKKPVVYVQNLATGARTAIAAFRGSNSAPAWSPDGRTLAVALTQDGLSQIYLINSDGSGSPRRLTSSSGIDTEPVFAPDGKSLYFTSDRGGSPQIYRISLGGGDATRVTFGSSYNVSPRISPDGKTLAFLTRREGRFLVAVRDLAGGNETLLSDAGREESPSFAPNGRWVMYATQAGGRDSLVAVSIDGRVRQRMTSNAGDIREPTWGPFAK